MKDGRLMTKDKRQNRGSIFIFVFYVLLSSVVGLRPAQSQDIAQQVNGFELEGFNEEGERFWEVKGEKADIFGDTIKITNVDANTFGEQEVNLKAKQGEVDKKSGNVKLREDVVVMTEAGDRLETDSLNWEKQNNVVSTADFAKITGKNIKATGIGLTAHPELKTAQLERNVIVEAQAEKEGEEKQQEIMITCDGPMELDQQNNMATLKENVVAVRGDQTLRADLVEIYFDSETRRIATIICTDNVSVQRGDNISYADKAIYSAADQKVRCVGRPKLIMTTEQEGESFF